MTLARCWITYISINLFKPALSTLALPVVYARWFITAEQSYINGQFRQ